VITASAFVRPHGGHRTSHTGGGPLLRNRSGPASVQGAVVFARVAGPVEPTVAAPRVDGGRGPGQGERGRRLPAGTAARAGAGRQARKVRRTRLPRPGRRPPVRRPRHTQGRARRSGGRALPVVGRRLLERQLHGRRGAKPDAHVRRARHQLLHRRRRRPFAAAAADGVRGETVVVVRHNRRAARRQKDQTVRHRHRFVRTLYNIYIMCVWPGGGDSVVFILSFWEDGVKDEVVVRSSRRLCRGAV